MLAKITLFGIERILNSLDRSLFDDIVLPDSIDKDTLKDSIFMRANEFPVIYTDYDYMDYMTKAFFKKYQDTFEKWAYATGLEYNPIHNYDRYEEFLDKAEGEKSGSSDHSESYTDNKNDRENETFSGRHEIDRATNVESTDHSETETNETISGSTTQNKGSVISQTGTNNETKSQATINAPTVFQPYERVATTSSGNTTSTENDVGSENKTDKIVGSNDSTGLETTTEAGAEIDSNQGTKSITGTDSGSSSGQASDATQHSDISEHTGHVYGNIGVTTSSKMLEEFMKTRLNWNLYEVISDLYVKEFCIMVY